MGAEKGNGCESRAEPPLSMESRSRSVPLVPGPGRPAEAMTHEPEDLPLTDVVSFPRVSEEERAQLCSFCAEKRTAFARNMRRRFFIPESAGNCIPPGGLLSGGSADIITPQTKKERQHMAQEKEAPLSLTERERKLILLLREIKFGEINLFVSDGQPVRVEEVRKSIKL